MEIQIRMSKRYAFCTMIVVMLITILFVINAVNQANVPAIVNINVVNLKDNSQPELPSVRIGGAESVKKITDRQKNANMYRFSNGHIDISNSRYDLSISRLSKMSPDDLETLYENVVQEITAECSTSSRFKNGILNLCLVGPFAAQQPCFVVSFGVNNVWKFDDVVTENFNCQVLKFDSSMSADGYLHFLQSFRAQNFVIDVLKMDIEASKWTNLENTVRDGSLKNVKQLILEVHIGQTGNVTDFQRYFAILREIHDLGFHMWQHNWNTFESALDSSLMRTFCHELHYINVNFLTSSKPARNPAGTQVAVPLNVIKVKKASGYSKVDTVSRINLKSMSETHLEETYFGIMEQQHVICPYSQHIGYSGDKGWDMCFSGSYNIMESKPCVAFSFGMNNAGMIYEDQLVDKYNCKVYIFDPSMANLNNHHRKKSFSFHRFGLSSENKLESNGWKMRTLCKLFEQLGYRDKTVDIVKIDIEHWEWASIEKALDEGCLSRVKQLIFESHTSEFLHQKSNYASFIRVWQGLFNLGFRTWKWHKSPKPLLYKSALPPYTQRACCHVHYMLNTNFTEL